MTHQSEKPIVYSCSGCSSAAQMANSIALQLDRESLAQMSCIAGVGGDVPSLLKLAKSERPIIALDGCPLACVASCLKRHNVAADQHFILSEFGVKKKSQTDPDPEETQNILNKIKRALKNI